MRRGFSLIELLIVIAIIMVILMVSIPNFQKAQVYAREMAALKAVQTIQAAQVQYQSRYGIFACSMRELGPPETGPSTAKSAGLINRTMASGKAGRYNFELACANDSYTLTATPSFLAGGRSFFSDESLTVRASDGPQPATANSPEYDH